MRRVAAKTKAVRAKGKGMLVDGRYALRRLKKAVPMDAVLVSYGLDNGLRVHRSERVGPCPLPGHGGDRSNRGAFRVHSGRGLWHCLTHCGGGDVVELVARMEGGDYAAAARRLALIEDASLAGWQKTVADETHTSTTIPFVPYTNQLRLCPDHPYLRRRGIEPHTARAFEAGWWPLAGFLAGCVGVRLHDLGGRALGYAGRHVVSGDRQRLGRWKLPRGLPKSNLLFNWHRARPFSRWGLIVVEGPFDAMKVWQAGYRSVVALLGSSPSEAQLARLVAAPKLTVMLDGDEAGRRGASKILSVLAPRLVRVVHLPDGRDPADVDEADLRRRLLAATKTTCWEVSM